jgi:hypothetical protein
MGREQRRKQVLKRVVFADSEVGRSNLIILWDGVVLGSSRGETRTKDKIRLEAKIQRKIIAISDSISEIDLRLRPPNARVLKPGVHEILFKVEEIELIDSLVSKVAWSGIQSIAVADLYDLLGGASEVEETDGSK